MTEYGHNLDHDLQSSKDRGQWNLMGLGIQGADHTNNGVIRTLQARRFYELNIAHHRLHRMRNKHCLSVFLSFCTLHFCLSVYSEHELQIACWKYHVKV